MRRITGFPCNDMVIDRAGHAYVGSDDTDHSDPGGRRIVMALNVNDVIAGLDPARRRKVEERAAELIATFPDRPPVELSGIAERESRD